MKKKYTTRTIDIQPIFPERNFKKHPYTPCEARVLEYLLSVDFQGSADDPIGELIAIARRS